MSEPMAQIATTSEPTSTSAQVGPPAAPVHPPRVLLLDSAVALAVVAVCAWQRHRFGDLTDSWLLALSLVFPVGNLLGLLLSLRAYRLREPALHYRMALGAMFTIYYGYLALHLAGLHESPLGTLLLNAAGGTPTAKIEAGIAIAALLLQTFVATDACQKTVAALHPAP
jgi:hypothetical protein